MAAKTAGICITLPQEYSWNSSVKDVVHLINNIANKTSVSVVVIFVPSVSLNKLTAAIEQTIGSTRALQLILSHRAVVDEPNVASLKGCLAFRIPSSQTTDEFDDYFQNLRPDSVEPSRNPWFRDYWQTKFQCNLDESGVFNENCTSSHVDLHMTSYKRHPYVSYVLNAVRAYMDAIDAVYNMACPQMNGSAPCHPLMMHTEQVLTQIRQINSTGADGGNIAFLPSGDFLYSSLQAVNYKMDNDTYRFLPVGSFTGGKLSLDPIDLELWNDEGMSAVTSVCRSPCLDKACGEPTPSMNQSTVYIKGDVILGGLFSVHGWNTSTSSCGALDESGFKRLEAMMYALDQINNDSNILPGLTLGMDGFDTCASPRLAGEQVLRVISEAQFEQSGSGQRPNAQGELEHVYGFVGPNSDEECELVNGVLNTYGVPTISYGAKSTFLSNINFYKNFARTVFTDNILGYAIVQALTDRGWKYVQLLRSNSQSAYSFSSLLQQAGGRADICVTNDQLIPSADDTEAIDNVFDILTSRPDAKTLVVFATGSSLRLVLEQFQNRSLFGQYYLVLIADWTSDPSLQQDFVDIAPGITFISEGKRSYDDFRRYFSNLTPTNNLRNPWMSEYWAKRFQCNLPDTPSQYSKNCTGTESLTLDDSTDRRISETVDAVYAIARAVSALRELHCPDQSNVCSEMIMASGNELFQLLTSRQNYFASITDGYMIELTTYGDVTPFYEVFNIQRKPNGSLVNTQVGTYQKYQYRANENHIVVYKKIGENFEEIDQPISICNGSCHDCRRKEKDPIAEIPNGDVWIGGLFELHEMDTDQLTCKEDLLMYNIQLVEAFMYAIADINSNPAILPDLQLGAIAFDTCASADRAHNEVFNFVSGKVDYRNGYYQIKPAVVGVIGGATSDTSLTTADVLTSFGINQISYAATTSELSDSNRFPFFLRTVPSDEKQAAAIVDTLLALEWQYISIVYSDDSYGNDILQKVTERMAQTSICVAMQLKVVTTYERIDYDDIVKQLQTNALARVVLLLTSHMATRQVLEAAERISIRHLQWIGTETWGDRYDVIQNAAVTSRGALVVQFQNSPGIEAFKDYFTSLSLYSNRRNPWWTTYWEDTFKCNSYGSSRYSNPCSFQLQLDSVYVQEAGVSYVLDAVQIFAKGLHNAMSAICPNTTRYICNDLTSQPEILHRHMLEARLNRTDGSFFKLDENGDGRPYFDLLTVQHNGTTNSYVKVGSWEAGTLNLSSFRPSVSSQCVGRCTECHVSNKQDNFARIPGSLQMLGLFAVHTSGNHLVECGRLREAGIVYLEAMMFAIDSINANTSILPGVDLGATVFDTCERSSRGVRALSSVFNGRLVQNETSTQQTWSLIAGVIGSENKEVTLDTAALADQYKYVQISYGMGVSDVDPDNFLLMESSVTSQIQAVTRLLLYFNWTFVGIISSRSAYRLQQKDAFIEEATNHKICIGTMEEVTADNSTFLQSIYETMDQNVVVLFLDEGDIPHFLNAVEMRNSKHITWVVAFSQDILDNYSNDRNLLGAFFINSIQPQITDFDNYISSLNATSNQRNPWFDEFIHHLDNCNSDNDGECSDSVANIVQKHEYVVNNVINSVYAIAHGVQDLLDQYCVDIPGLCADFVGLAPTQLQQAVRNTTFTGLDGQTVQFDHGTLVQQFSISTIKAIDDNSNIQKIGNWTGGNISIQNNQVSFYNLQGDPSTTPVPSQCLTAVQCVVMCPHTRPATTKAPTTHMNSVTTEAPTTHMNSVTTKAPTTHMNSVTTKATVQTTHTVSTALHTTPPLPTMATSASPSSTLLSVNNFQSPLFIILIIFAVIGILASICLIVLFILRWKTSAKQVMSPFLCVVLLAGNIMVYLLVPILAAQPDVLTCSLLRMWPGLAFAVCQAAVLIMCVRLYRKSRIVYNVSGDNPNLSSTWNQLALFVILMAVEIVIVVEWLVLQPAEVTEVTSGDNDGLMSVCAYGQSSLGPLSYVYLLLACAGVIMLLPWQRKVMISRVELVTLSTIIIGSAVVLIVWHLLEHLSPVTYHRPGMSIIAVLKATMILLLTLVRAKALTSSDDPLTASGFTGKEDVDLSICHFAESGDLQDDENMTGNQIVLTEAMQG